MATSNKKKALLAASIAGLMTFTVASAAHADMSSEGAPCYGINACKGTGDCGGKGYSCAGKNACKGQGYIKLPADTCARINGGSLTTSCSLSNRKTAHDRFPRCDGRFFCSLKRSLNEVQSLPPWQ